MFERGNPQWYQQTVETLYENPNLTCFQNNHRRYVHISRMNYPLFRHTSGGGRVLVGGVDWWGNVEMVMISKNWQLDFEDHVPGSSWRLLHRYKRVYSS